MGSTSRDVAREEVMTVLVHWMFFCFIRMWPLLVTRDLGRCFVMSNLLRTGQEAKLLRQIAWRKVKVTGLKAQS